MTRSILTEQPTLLPTPRSLPPELLRILRARLEIQRDFRVDQLDALASVDAPRPVGGAEHEVHTSLWTGADTALREIRRALWRLDEGCFGRCVECTEPLDIARLAAVPHATRCEGCAR